MERSPAAVWTFLLGAGLALVLPPAVSTASSEAQPPRLIGCVFLNRANVTCRWEAGDAPVTHYTLQVRLYPGAEPLTSNNFLETFTCSTSDTSCTAGLSGSSVRFTFCVIITAHTRSGNLSSTPRCQPGRTEVMLPPAILHSVQPVSGKPQCLNVTWSRTLSVFPVSTSEIQAGYLNSQIEITAEGQLHIQDKNVTSYSFLVCLFRPDTSYTIRIRHRYRGSQSPWSSWSNKRQGRTAADAPSAAPAFWRRVKQAEENGRRLVLLLWKPLPRFLANGKVLYYNVTCQTEGTHILNSTGSCRDLNHTRTSCNMLLPAGSCSCFLTASNSAGTSPEARIWLLGTGETEPPSPSQITSSPLDENNLEVRWTSAADRSVSGYVVEWFAVRENKSSTLFWEKLNGSCTSLIITEGVKPMERYEVSVKGLYGERGAGGNRTLHIYTVQGAPSAGPTLEVKQISGGRVQLSWSPVSVELLHGFIRNYTLCYAAANQPARSVFVRGYVRCYSLDNLLPGNYDIFIRANTDPGAGAAGPTINVHIGSDEASIVIYTMLPITMTSLVLVLMVCLAQKNMVKQKLCRGVPDPSHSSVAQWTPKTTLESKNHPAEQKKPDIRYSQVILLGESELQTCDLDQNYHSLCRLPERFTGMLSYCPTVSADDATLPKDGVEVDHFLRQYQIPVSFPDLSSVAQSTTSPCHTAEVSSPKHPFSQSDFDSGPSLQPRTFTHSAASSFLPPLVVDFSYCSVECDPYISV